MPRRDTRMQLSLFYVCRVCHTPVPFDQALRFRPDATVFNYPLHRACAELERRGWPIVEAQIAEAAR